MLNKILQQLKVKKGLYTSTSPIDRSLSKHALELYEKKTDLKKFTKLAMSDPEDLSHNELVAENNIIDPIDEEHLNGLINNDNFLKDLGL